VSGADLIHTGTPIGPLDPVIERKVTLYICGQARDKADAVYLLQVLGLCPYRAAPRRAAGFKQ
jgi:hypothetical protein